MIKELVQSKKFLNTITKLQKDNWSKLNEENRIKCLQEIVDAYLSNIKKERRCDFTTKHFLKYSTIGQYDEIDNTISLQYELVVNDRLELGEKQYLDIKDSSNYIFYYLSHEIAHAIQDYCVKNKKELCLENNEVVGLLEINNTKKTDECVYFHSPNKNSSKSKISTSLYMLQPIERQAFEFAYNEYKEFISIMHDIFPQDPAYSKVKDYVQFETVLSDAKILYHTNDPVLDIDNIIKTFGNRFVEIPLNALMCNEIENLYPEIGQKIKQNELTNLKITEDKQKQCNKEIYSTEEIEQLFIEK